MKRILLAALAVMLALPLAADSTVSKSAVLASSFDLDGLAANDARIVADTLIVDSTNYTIANQPETCRLLKVTITDADSLISAGTFTIQGNDCWGRKQQATYTMSGGSGVRTGTLVTYVVGGTSLPPLSSGAYFSTVDTAGNGVVTGEGVGDNVRVGFTDNSPKT